MAGNSPGIVGELRELRELAPGSLHDLLIEETAAWRRELRWDFEPSAALVRQFADEQTLGGHALVSGREVLGYAYTVADNEKGLIGDLFVREQYRTVERENRLLAACVDSLAKMRGIRRIEAQILLLKAPRPMPAAYHDQLQIHERQFLQCALRPWPAWPSGAAQCRLDIDSWHSRYHDEAARLLADSYDGHVDSQINDQYQSIGGARRFLTYIVDYPGCGAFDEEASLLAWNRDTGRLVGMCLASRVAPETGHVTQVCVSPSVRGRGVAFALMVDSLRAMSAAGCSHCSLTVTSANRKAISLYERMGFVRRQSFAAMVWDGIRPPRRGFFS
jgi:ribosomal protein S18 acetylase RimI-like enzyme